MKESKFVQQNKKNWSDLETDLRTGSKTKHNRFFIQVTDDLSYARTFYKYRSVRVYLNGIAQILFNNLYQNQSSSWQAFKNFWIRDLPFQVYESRKEFRITFLVFLLAIGIGMLSSIYDRDFPRLILGNEYVNMTIENIKHNDPMAVYKKGNEADMFLGITMNNLIVSLYTFVLGAFMSVGTILALLRNGIMLGSFQYFFIERGLFKESFLTIWQHGTIEISCIIIAGAAGLTLGKGLISPGTYSRSDSFKMSALRGLKIFLGIVPLILVAGFIESFITRHTDVNPIVRITVIIVSLTFILFYFVWYPRKVRRQAGVASTRNEILSYKEPVHYDFSRILSSEEILGNTFKYFNQNIFSFLLLIIAVPVVHAFTAVLFSTNQSEIVDETNSFVYFFELESIKAQFLLGIISLTWLQVFLCRKISKISGLNQEGEKPVMLFLIISALIASVITLLPFALGIFWGVISLIFIAPLLFLIVYHSYMDGSFLLATIPWTFQILSNSWYKMYWSSLKVFSFVFVLYILASTPVVSEYIQGIFLNFQYDNDTVNLLRIFVTTLVVVALFVVYAYFIITTSVFNFYAFSEISLAHGLRKRIERFGERNSLFGFEKEQRK